MATTPATIRLGPARIPLGFRLGTLAEILLSVYVLSFPLMAFAPIDVAGKGIVLSALLSLPLLPLLLVAPPFKSRIAPSLLALLVWQAWIVAAIFVSGLRNGGAELKTFTQLLSIGIMVTQFVAARHILARLDLSRLYRLRTLLVVGALVMCAYAFYELVSFTFGLPFSYVLRNANIYAIRPDPAETRLFSNIVLFRVMAFTPEPSYLASYLVAILALLLPKLVYRPSTATTLSFAVLLLTLFLTFGRTGWLAFVGVLAYAMVRLSKSWLKNMLVVGALLALFLGGFLALGGQVGLLFSTSVDERLFGQILGLRLMLNNPIFGVGLGNYGTEAVAQYGYLARADIVGGLKDTFNLYLQLGAETGMVGLALFLGFLLLLHRGLLRIRAARQSELGVLANGLELALVAIMLAWLNLGSYNLSYIWFILAMAAALPRAVQRQGGVPASLPASAEPGQPVAP